MIYQGGLPYGPDKEKLDAAFPVAELTEGRVLPHARLSEALGLQIGAQRYYAVINAWRYEKRAKQNIIMEWRDRQGLKVLPPNEVLDDAETSTIRAGRSVRRAVRKFNRVDRNRLDETGQRRYDHTSRNAAILEAAVGDSLKKMAIELPALQALPRRIDALRPTKEQTA